MFSIHLIFIVLSMLSNLFLSESKLSLGLMKKKTLLLSAIKLQSYYNSRSDFRLLKEINQIALGFRIMFNHPHAQVSLVLYNIKYMKS